MKNKFSYFLLCFFCLLTTFSFGQKITWKKDANAYLQQVQGEIIEFQLPDFQQKTLVSSSDLTPSGAKDALEIKQFTFTDDYQKVLIFTNTQRVWRYETRGDYWVFDIKNKKLQQLGKGRVAASLMFAKISPDGQQAAYVSERNIYVENLTTGKIKQLTQSGNEAKLINGTFDWVYEEEFGCRDGFSWCSDSKRIAYWQINANQVRNFYMINNTDSIYSQLVPVEYPKVGENPSPYKIGVVDIKSAKTKWMNMTGDLAQSYLPRMQWADGEQLILQQLNRPQNESKLLYANAKTGQVNTFQTEKNDTWVELNEGDLTGYWQWIDAGKAFIWTSEKGGWRQVYRVNKDGSEQLLSPGNYDVIKIYRIDERNGFIYFAASPDNATQQYLYRIKLDGSSQTPERITPMNQSGKHEYSISPDGRYASHGWSNHFTPYQTEWVELPSHKVIKAGKSVKAEVSNMEFFQVTTKDGITMDGWLMKPNNFDPTKKYPIVYYVYSEPAGATVMDEYGIAGSMYMGDMAEDGYIYASLDGRGTPAPKGRDWRKAIYRNIGQVNIRDQAMGAKAMFERWAWIDTSRVAIWGWSGGGSATLNCLFQYPDIYKTGIAVAAVANQLTYDNIYQERYMGVPSVSLADYKKGSPMTYAKNLRGNLLYIHGTGDDNVHYQNAEILVNELIKYNKQFQFMPYPNRSHGIYEGDGTSLHLATLFTEYLKKHCEGGGR